MFNKESVIRILDNGKFREFKAAIRELRKERGDEYAILSNGDRVPLHSLHSVNGITL